MSHLYEEATPAEVKNAKVRLYVWGLRAVH